MSEYNSMEDVAVNESELLKALTAGESAAETETIELAFRGVSVRFRIRPLSEREWDNCREKCTKYQRNRRFGNMKLPESTDTTAYHSLLIYTATVEEDRKKLWDNQTYWNAVNAVTGTDMVDKLIPYAGKKQQIVERIEKLSGYDDEGEVALEETVKN